MYEIKKINIAILFFFFISSCVSTGKIKEPKRSDLVYKRFIGKYDRSHMSCGAWELRGIIHVISKVQGFRGTFILKGNEQFPWIMEIRWGFGSLVSITKIYEHKIVSYNIKEERVYRFNNPSNIFHTLGLDVNLSPNFYLNLLTGKWKKIIKTYKKTDEDLHGTLFVIEDGEVEKFYIKDNLDEWKLELRNGVVIEGYGNTNFRVRHKREGDLFFKIKSKTCLQDPLLSGELELKIPNNVEVYEIK